MEPQKKGNAMRIYFSQYFSEYTNHTSLHGFQYLGDKQRTWFERLLWSLIIVTSITICITFITDSCMKWMNAPIIISKDFKPSPVENIPFPAITICPENKIVQEVYNFSKDVERYINTCINNTSNCTFDDSDAHRFKLGALLCESDLFFEFHTISLNSTLKSSFKEHLDDIVNMSHHTPKGMFLHCRWNNGTTKLKCLNKFVPMFTEDGICFTFNMLSREDIFSNEVNHYNKFGFVNNTTENESDIIYPMSTYASGSGSGLTVMIFTDFNEMDFSCTTLPESFKVILHHPSDIPRPGKISSKKMTSFIVETKQEVVVQITPEVFETSESLNKYSPKNRGCYYPSDRKLKYFKEYSEQKCEFECIRNATYKECGCVPYYMPIIDPNTPVCELDNYLCMLNTKENLIFIKNNSEASCECLPSCSSVFYNVETSSKKFNLIRRIRATGYQNKEELAGKEVSKIKIFFKESNYYVNTRTELYGFTAFISDCGGLLGLFVGFSIISIVETIYFAVKTIINIRQMRKEKREMEERCE